jgi:hypothetical protein
MNPLFNSVKILIIMFEFAMYSLELEIKLKKKIKLISDLPTLFFFHNVSGNTTFFVCGLIHHFHLMLTLQKMTTFW